MEYDLNRSATRFEQSRHVEIARTCLRQVENHVCDQVCGMDSVMEFDPFAATPGDGPTARAGPERL